MKRNTGAKALGGNEFAQVNSIPKKKIVRKHREQTEILHIKGNGRYMTKTLFET